MKELSVGAQTELKQLNDTISFQTLTSSDTHLVSGKEGTLNGLRMA